MTFNEKLTACKLMRRVFVKLNTSAKKKEVKKTAKLT